MSTPIPATEQKLPPITHAQLKKILAYCVANPSWEKPMPMWMSVATDGAYVIAILEVIAKE